MKARAGIRAGNKTGQPVCAIHAMGVGAWTERRVDEKTLPRQWNKVPT
jgi:hypothetical protein